MSVISEIAEGALAESAKPALGASDLHVSGTLGRTGSCPLCRVVVQVDLTGTGRCLCGVVIRVFGAHP